MSQSSETDGTDSLSLYLHQSQYSHMVIREETGDFLDNNVQHSDD